MSTDEKATTAAQQAIESLLMANIHLSDQQIQELETAITNLIRTAISSED